MTAAEYLGYQNANICNCERLTAQAWVLVVVTLLSRQRENFYRFVDRYSRKVSDASLNQLRSNNQHN